MQLTSAFNYTIDAITKGKYWLWKSAFALSAIALFFAFPSYGDILPETWQPLFAQAIHPFSGGQYGDGSHEGKLAFRLVVPLMVHFTHAGIKGVLFMLGIIGILNFYMVVRLAGNILGNRRHAFITGLCTAFIYFGKCSFTELRGTMYDGIAIFFLLCALNARQYILTGLCILLAAWCDERALIASALVWLFYYVQYDHKSFVARLFTGSSISIYVAWAAYFFIRYVLAHQYGLRTATGGVGISVLLDQINNIPIGIWSALEGLWIPVLFSVVLMYRNKKRIEMLAFIVICAIILLAGVSVVDITRSVVYVLPAIFVALFIINRYKPGLTGKLLVYAVILCFAYPAYYTGGKSSIWWNYPLPLQLLRFIG